MQEIEIAPGLLYRIDDSGQTVASEFPDGSVCCGVASFTKEDYDRALSLGYKGDEVEATWAMHRHHDLLHHIVARSQGWPYSIVLHAVANNYSLPPHWGNTEERLVFLLTKALNEGLEGILPQAT